MPVWLLPVLLAALGGAAGQAKTHHAKGTLEGAGLGALGGMGLGSLIGAGGAAGAGAAGAGSGAGSGLAAGAASDAATAASGAPFAGVGSMLGAGIDAGTQAAALPVGQAALSAASPSLWSQLGAAGLKGATSTAASTGVAEAMTPKQKVNTPLDSPFAPLPQFNPGNQMQMLSYQDQLRQLGFI